MNLKYVLIIIKSFDCIHHYHVKSFDCINHNQEGKFCLRVGTIFQIYFPIANPFPKQSGLLLLSQGKMVCVLCI
jgi:hypothetical protein